MGVSALSFPFQKSRQTRPSPVVEVHHCVKWRKLRNSRSFSADRKDPMLSDGSRRWSGSRFQTIGPAMENARRPNLLCSVTWCWLSCDSFVRWPVPTVLCIVAHICDCDQWCSGAGHEETASPLSPKEGMHYSCSWYVGSVLVPGIPQLTSFQLPPVLLLQCQSKK